MKKHLRTFSVVLVGLCYSLPTFGQYHAIKGDIFGGLFSPLKVYRLSYERSIHENWSIGSTFEAGEFAQEELSSVNSSLKYSTRGIGILPEVKFYPFGIRKTAPAGLFVGSHYRFRNQSISFRNVTVHGEFPKINTHHVGVHTGYKIVQGNLLLEFLGGYNLILLADNFETNPDYKLRFEMSVGFTFPKMANRPKRYSSVLSSQASSNYSNKSEAVIVIYRPKRFSGSLVNLDVSANDKQITRLKNGSYYIYKLSEDSTITIEAKHYESEIISFPVEKGHTYFLKGTVKFGLIAGRPKLEIMDPIKGKAEFEAIVK